MVEMVKNEAYKLKIFRKEHIHPVFCSQLSQRDVKRRKTVNCRNANTLKFEQREQQKRKVDCILYCMIITQRAAYHLPLSLYYLIFQKKETDTKNNWESIEGVSHLQQPLQRYNLKNSQKLTIESSCIVSVTPPTIIVPYLRAKVALFIPSVTRSSLLKYSLIQNQIPLPVPIIS